MRKLWTGVPLAVQNLKARIARNFYQAGNRALGELEIRWKQLRARGRRLSAPRPESGFWLKGNGL